jgi:DNA-binding NarL/FixJ family response regulator
MTIRILVVDDHGVLRAGLAAMLNAEAGLTVIGEAFDEDSAVQAALREKPDVVLMDLSMPESGGFEATRCIRSLAPEVRVLILTAHEDVSLMQEAIRSGAMGYISKKAIKSDLITAIQTIAKGEIYIHSSMAHLLLLNSERAAAQANLEITAERLTQREVEVLRLIAQGYTNQQTANILNVSTRTIEYHRANLTGKLNLHSRVDLMRYAEQTGLM